MTFPFSSHFLSFACTTTLSLSLSLLELNQIAEEFVKICGSPSGMINAQEFGDLAELLGWPSDRTVDCFR